MPAAIGLMVCICVGIALWAHFSVSGPGPSQQAGNIGSGSPPEVPGENLPSSQQLNAQQLAEKGAVPVLQRGVTAGEVTRYLELGTATDIPAYTKTFLTAHQGDVISLRFKNDSDPSYNYHHDFVLTRPGKAGDVIIQADRAGPQMNYIPASSDVLAATRLLAPGGSDTIIFRAPRKPGDYPFLCTYPGHGKVMHGILRIQ